MLQSRAVAHDGEKKLIDAFIPGLDKPNIRISQSSGIKFCPWCGCNLTKWIEQNRALAEQIQKKSVDVIDF